MSADVRNMLTSAAPEPTEPPDVIAIRARARVLGRTRRVNLLMAVTLMAVGTLGVVRAIPALNPAKVSPNQPAGFGPPSGSTPEDGPTGRYWMEFVTADGTGNGLLKTDVGTGSVCFWYNSFDRAAIYERGSDGGRPTVVIIPSETEFEPGPDELDPDSDGTTDGRCSLVERDRLQEIYDHPLRYELRVHATTPVPDDLEAVLMPVPEPTPQPPAPTDSPL